METAAETLYSKLKEHGLKGRIVSINHLQDLQGEIENQRANGLFNEEFYQEGMSFFSFQVPDVLTSTASLIVIAVPRPQTKVSFTLDEKTHTLIIPPTYFGFTEISQKVENLLNEWFAPKGHNIFPAMIPRKLLAVRSGLARYGRNNITYIPEIGSFFQLTAFFSDVPCMKDIWVETNIMDNCQSCKICINKCPTNAIDSERFLIHAERCLTFHNERSPNHSFPSWISTEWHNCLIGCMLCQQFCPMNKPHLNWYEGNEEFSHEETLLLLNGAPGEQLPTTTREKLERLGMFDILKIITRNLNVFFSP